VTTKACERVSASTTLFKALLSKPVICASLLWVRQDGVRFSNFLESFLRQFLLVRIFVRVPFDRKFAVRFLNSVFVRIFVKTKDGVVII